MLGMKQLPKSNKRFTSQFGRDEEEAIRKYERKTPLLPLSAGAQKMSDPLPSTSKCANTATAANPVSSKKKRKIETPCKSTGPNHLSKQVFNSYQPIKDVHPLASVTAGMPDRKPETSPSHSLASASVMPPQPLFDARIPPPQSYFPQPVVDKPVFPSFTFSPPVLAPTPVAPARVVSSPAVVEPRKKVKREASPDIEVIADWSHGQTNVILPNLKQPEPKTTDEEKEKLQILFDICAQELKINNDLKEKRKEIDDLQRKINMARADERQLNKDLASLVQQKRRLSTSAISRECRMQ
uniref:Uncharacterized protein n=1 Tax=Ditylenchus dipsaci TaxID=166011 RepID=A0A915DIH7_9BILA